jgi:hypothetical protein
MIDDFVYLVDRGKVRFPAKKQSECVSDWRGSWLFGAFSVN